MEKSITELNLSDLEAVVGGVDLTTVSPAYKIPTGSTSGTMNQPPKQPAPQHRPTSSLL